MLLYQIFPSEIIEIIWNYIPISIKVWVSKTYYEKYHYSIIYPSLKLNYNSYMRWVIRNQYIYLMKINVVEHYSLWSSKLVNIKYKNKTYPMYISYIKTLALENNSNKIYSLIKNYEKENEKNNKTNKSLKSNKKIKYKKNQWSN